MEGGTGGGEEKGAVRGKSRGRSDGRAVGGGKEVLSWEKGGDRVERVAAGTCRPVSGPGLRAMEALLCLRA